MQPAGVSKSLTRSADESENTCAFYLFIRAHRT